MDLYQLNSLVPMFQWVRIVTDYCSLSLVIDFNFSLRRPSSNAALISSNFSSNSQKLTFLYKLMFITIVNVY